MRLAFTWARLSLQGDGNLHIAPSCFFIIFKLQPIFSIFIYIPHLRSLNNMGQPLDKESEENEEFFCVVYLHYNTSKLNMYKFY